MLPLTAEKCRENNMGVNELAGDCSELIFEESVAACGKIKHLELPANALGLLRRHLQGKRIDILLDNSPSMWSNSYDSRWMEATNRVYELV